MAIISEQFLESVALKREGVPSFESYPFHLDAVRTLDELPLACSPKIEPSVMRVPGACRVYDSHEKKKTYPRTDR